MIDRRISYLLFGILLCSGCYYDVEEVLYQTLECSTENVTYTGVVLPIIQDNCYGCHNAAANSGNITLEGYDNLKIMVDNEALLGVLRHKPGYSPMPKNLAPLIECDIEKIEAWVAEGAPNN